MKNSALGNIIISNAYESPSRSNYDNPIYSGKSNLDRDTGMMRNIDLDINYNTSIGNINDNSTIIDLSKQSISKYDTNRFPESLKNTTQTFTIINKTVDQNKTPLNSNFGNSGSVPRKTENYISRMMAGYNSNKKERSSRSNYSERVNMVSHYDSNK